MFHHVKELQFNARVSQPDPRFAALLLEQFGGPNGELKAAMQYFVQAFAARMPYPDKYDLLMDIATEEFSHLEVVGATVMMLLDGINGELKNAAEGSELMQMLEGQNRREDMIHALSANPQFFVLTGGGPRLTDSQGQPWSGAYVTANGDLTVDLRSNIAAESRAKIVYEYLLQFTNDPLVKESLQFLMTREIAHFQQFNSALASIAPNFPPGVLQGDPRFTHLYFNLSSGNSARGPWNQGQGTWDQGEWVYVDDPLQQVYETEGLTTGLAVEGSTRTEKERQTINSQLSQQRSQEVKKATPRYPQQWSVYSQATQQQ
jgi:Mn-containing catalase